MFYQINKKRGISSFKAIKEFAKENHIKKIGHAGTLDPLAQGLLIVATDQDTKMLSLIANDDKEYYVKAFLHRSSASYDEGEPITYLENKHITKEMLLKVLDELKNTTTQLPPAFSAKKVNGVRSYLLARDNKNVVLKPNAIKIHYIKLIDFNYEEQSFIFETKVSKGTYIRSMVHDIGLMLATDACTNILKRTKVGNISLDEKNNFSKINDIRKLFGVSLYTLTKNQIILLAKQQPLFIENLAMQNDQTIFTFLNEIIGYGTVEHGNIKFTKLFYPVLDKIIKGE
ncbi:tRNA pseudouridine synthase B [Metamycoplasma arthritidis]|uniref:tRNA pseudouridine(55) synthase n=1 Tax=Metamycoplasma arthritidis (strain 158L3-1) TaxID=243272 RepID=B3PMC8_META1|nr:tRNA pseudouridine synthase B [Metamycoplasma arthritidis]ACF07180.1 tRNA pseudouridine synthase B [Metamycoplasma arthritidis 158L3-1]VEU78704.1 tRNA pseudouridine synthase B [Metamycoplasma arthritidis]